MCAVPSHPMGRFPWTSLMITKGHVEVCFRLKAEKG